MTSLLSVDWITAHLPTDPSPLMCFLPSVSSFLGTPSRDSAFPDLSASAEQSRNFEQLPGIAFQPPKIVPAQLSDFPGGCGNSQNSVTLLPLCSRLHKGNETTRRTINIYKKWEVPHILSQTSILVPLATKGWDSHMLDTYSGSSRQPSCSVLASVWAQHPCSTSVDWLSNSFLWKTWYLFIAECFSLCSRKLFLLSQALK